MGPNRMVLTGKNPPVLNIPLPCCQSAFANHAQPPGHKMFILTKDWRKENHRVAAGKQKGYSPFPTLQDMILGVRLLTQSSVMLEDLSLMMSLIMVSDWWIYLCHLSALFPHNTGSNKLLHAGFWLSKHCGILCFKISDFLCKF